MRIVILLCAIFYIATASEFAPNSACKECHPLIYDEYMSSQHSKASIFKDEIHAAVWSKHPKNIKLKAYGCAHCHTPAASNLKELTAPNNGVVPDVNNTTHTDGISCAYCHRIKSISLGAKRNKNILSADPKSFFGDSNISKTTPFHTVIVRDVNSSSSDICMGCHSHKKNKFKFNVCITTMPKSSDTKSCVSCHMPKQSRESNQTTRFHGFAGINSYAPMLEEHVELGFEKIKDGFSIVITNKTPHALSLHPLRVMQLRVSVDNKALKSVNFLKLIGSDGKPTPPWLAKEVVLNSVIQADESRVVEFTYDLSSKSKIDVVLGYYLVNPKALKGLGLEQSENVKRFRIFKEQSFKL